MIIMAGCGALGSQIGLHLALAGRTFTLIDFDTVEPENIATTVYSERHIGALKANVLSDLLYRKAGCIAVPNPRRLERKITDIYNEGVTLVVCTFDSLDSRLLCHRLSVPCVQVGVSAERTGAVIWDEHYAVPEAPVPAEANPVCTHQLGRNILRTTSALAAGIIESYLATGDKQDLWVTEDYRVYR